MCGFPFLSYILQSPGTRGLGDSAWGDLTAPLQAQLSELDVAWCHILIRRLFQDKASGSVTPL